MKNKNGISKVNNNKKFNNYADILINRINTILTDSLNKSTRIDSGIVNMVNQDGTVDIYFPPDKTKIFTNISNQTSYDLNEGDSVEILIKNGQYSNCWVIAKHGIKGNPKSDFITALNDLNKLNGVVTKLREELNNTVEELDTIKSELNNVTEELDAMRDTLNNTIEELNTVKGELNMKANINSPIFTGTPKAPTVSSDVSDDTIATTEFVINAINNI